MSLVLAACGGGARPSDDASGRALASLDFPDGGPSLPTADTIEAPADVPLFTFEPPELMVYRATAVHFRATPPSDHAAATCTWTWGDGEPATDGCVVSHTFHNGTADQRVTLTLTDHDWGHTSMRTVPLERLPVSSPSEQPSADNASIPAAPKAGPTSFRAVLLADVGTDLGGLARRIVELAPELVIVVGGAAAPGDPAPW